DDVIEGSDQSAADRWVVLDDVQAGDPFLVGGLPALAFVFDGPGAARSASATSLAPSDPQINLGPRLLTYQWNSVTIPPGGTIALMHFAVQQTSRPGAQASAERLVQLPPEALAGLTADELNAVQNFAIPQGGVSSVTPL